MDLSAPIETIKGIGPKTATILRQAGLETVGDLLYFLPRTYENYQAAASIASLRPGKVMVKGKISNLKTIPARRRRLMITEGIIRDQSGAIRTVWFNQAYRVKQFDPKREYYFTGNYEFKRGRYQLTSPSAVLAEDVERAGQTKFQPIYSAKSTLKPQFFQKILQNLRPDFVKIPDLLPIDQASAEYVSPGIRAEALFQAHFPENASDSTAGRQYLAYEELFELILAAKLNQQANQKLHAPALPFRATFTRQLVASLPFQLTGAQRRATWEILQDLGRTIPMNRLLQGDVGSGKTLVAALAASQVALYGHQVALLAPTSILAAQHYESLTQLFQKSAIKNPTSQKPLKLALLTGATKQKATLKSQIATGEIDFVIGTHALLTDDTKFHSLALCIIDEQHRFGVEQRQKLLLKSPADMAPHLLSMTATPIPRSLQLTVFGDLDISILDELPTGRQSIKTYILSETDQITTLYPAMRQLLATGQQIYWICPAIDEQNVPTIGGRTSTPVKQQAKKLAELFPNYHIGVMHGKLKPKEKDQVMQDFLANRTQILVSTTVVEVGVNVPNANMIIIQDAEHYGLAQLHQLRGRVGRGNQPASCYLLTSGETQPSRRLRELEKSTDGFHLAEVDLKLRGPGEIYGSLQHGALNLQFANLTDRALITAASRHASTFAKHSADLSKYPELAQRIKKYQQLTTLN